MSSCLASDLLLQSSLHRLWVEWDDMQAKRHASEKKTFVQQPTVTKGTRSAYLCQSGVPRLTVTRESGMNASKNLVVGSARCRSAEARSDGCVDRAQSSLEHMRVPESTVKPRVTFVSVKQHSFSETSYRCLNALSPDWQTKARGTTITSHRTTANITRWEATRAATST